MTRKNYAMIPVLAAVILIPQLLFWWLAPTGTEAHLAVYIAGSILTAVIPLSCFLLYWSSDLRRTTGLSVVAAILQVAIMVLSATLLGTDATNRSALFAFAIAALVCLIVLVPLFGSVLRARPEGIYPIDESTDPPVEPFDPDDRQVPIEPQPHTPAYPPHRPMPPRPSRQPSHSTPLPPRSH